MLKKMAEEGEFREREREQWGKANITALPQQGNSHYIADLNHNNNNNNKNNSSLLDTLPFCHPCSPFVHLFYAWFKYFVFVSWS